MKRNKPGWDKIRQKGKFQYILFYWILGWGIPVGVLSAFFGELFEKNMTFSHFEFNSFMVRVIWITIMFFIVSYYIGLRTWKIQEKIWKENNGF